MEESKLIHLIDYPTLQEYGFKWAIQREVNNENIVTNYVAEMTHTDLFSFETIMLMWFAHPNCNVMWQMSTMSKKKRDRQILFYGTIRSKTALKYILKSILIFKPNNKEK